ncbi:MULTISPECIES: hypothetical protein [unclassified Aureispira]|uniref:hypothetical protein n=1 Tax=unclassified Aureispira TaxID=2649989 RepID=UPI0006973F2C|nr:MULTISPECIES: hypothetical protein [unclassified Aureispira]WMX12806.1 hypothetical protein QP953_18385 [Aureispira sp. CCB-E]
MKQLLLLILPFMLLFYSCGETVPEDSAQKELLVGSWVFDSGTRDGRTEGTELLNNLVFTFTESEFKCELLPEMMPSLNKEEPYELKDNSIIVDEKFNLQIKDLSQESLSVEFDLTINESPTTFALKFKPQQSIQ